MANREKILDGLAWAGVGEQTRIAKIAAMLVREDTSSYSYNQTKPTKTRIKEAVRNTSPPYGRGKIICEAVTAEFDRQQPIYKRRQAAQTEWLDWVAHKAKLETRFNDAYAARFDRPTYAPNKSYPGNYYGGNQEDWDKRQAWDTKEDARDKGDECIAITHWKEHTICLVINENADRHPHIATRLRDGEIVRTYLRGTRRAPCSHPEDLVQAAISLGGPKVRAALALGIRVTTDWVGRRSIIHYQPDKEAGPVCSVGLELPWLSCEYIKQPDQGYGRNYYDCNPVVVHGTSIVPDKPDE